MEVGTDIAGWIEVRDGRASVWSGVVHLTPILDRDYDTFGSLFGVSNFAGFAPIAAGRGLPDDCSAEVRAEIAEWDPHGETWASAAELAAIDWDEHALHADARIHKYRRTASGQLIYVGKASYDRDFPGNRDGRRPGDPPPLYDEGTQWAVGDLVFRAETMSRRQASNTSMDGAIRQAADLASVHGAGYTPRRASTSGIGGSQALPLAGGSRDLPSAAGSAT